MQSGEDDDDDENIVLCILKILHLINLLWLKLVLWCWRTAVKKGTRMYSGYDDDDDDESILLGIILNMTFT